MTTTRSTRRARLYRLTGATLAVPLALSIGLLAACAPDSAAEAGPRLGLEEPLPTSVPEGTRIIVGDPQTKPALRLSGKLEEVSEFVEFVNLSGGPATTEAFRANALDVGAVADIPPIHATWTGLPVKIVAAKYRKEPVKHPIYELGIAPGVRVQTLADLRGKKIAYSPGQAQGALVLRVLQKAGLTQQDVELVELPSTGDVYPTALAAKEIEVAPIGGVQVKRYLSQYGKDGASSIKHGLRDDPSHLYVLQSSLENAHKAAAIRKYVEYWAAAQRWVDEHPEEWLQGYYVEDQGVSEEDGRWLIKNVGHPEIPTDWTTHIANHQATIDLLAKEEDKPELDAEDLWDRRFEKVGGAAFERGDAR